MKNLVRLFIAGLIFISVCAASFMFLVHKDERVGFSDSVKIIRNVNKFGEQFKKVSLTAPEEVVINSIKSNYSSFVDSRLMDLWTQNPERAPGRLTSSPWPERVKITDIKEVKDGLYNISGDIILMTSMEKTSKKEDNAGSEPFNLFLDGETKDIVAFNNKKVEIDSLDLSLLYSKLFSTEKSLPKRAGFWSEFSEVSGENNLTLYLSGDYFEGTNFSEAYITIGSSSKSGAVERCSEGDQVSVNGYDFAHKSREEGAAGNFYQVDSYEKVLGNSCLAIESVIHTTNIHNYPEGAVEEIDLEMVNYLLDSVIRSVKLNN